LATRNAQDKINYPTPGPKINVGGGGIKNFLGNWGSTIGGSQLGAGLGSMLLGPWGMLLGSIFGGGAGRRAWKAGQTDEKETLKDILFGNPNTKDTMLSNLFNPQPKVEGIETIDIRDIYDRRKTKPINKYDWDIVEDSPNYANDYISLAEFSPKQKKKAEKELEFGVEPKHIMPKLQQLDPTSWGMKTDKAIKAQEFIGFLEKEKGMKLTEDQKREIYEAAGQEMGDSI